MTTLEQLQQADQKAADLLRYYFDELRAEAPFSVGDQLQAIDGNPKTMQVIRIAEKRHWKTKIPYLSAVTQPLKKDGTPSLVGTQEFNLIGSHWNGWKNLTTGKVYA